MATIDIQVKCELNRPVVVRHLDGMVFSQDAQANRIVVHVVRNGVPEDIDGNVSANIIRADGTTVVQTGESEDNVATVTLPSAAYAVPGPIGIFVKVSGADTAMTIAAVTGYVYKSTTDTIVDPGTVVPNINELLAMIEDCEEATAACIAATEAAPVIDDTAGEGDTNKVWSADKLSELAPKASPSFTGSVSMGRYGNAGTNSTALGSSVEASGSAAFAEGAVTTASGSQSHAEGQGTTASGSASHSEGQGTVANHKAQHVFGTWNVPDNSSNAATQKGTYVEIVGNGTDTGSGRSNARTLDWSGNEELAGDLTVNKGTENEFSVNDLKGAIDAFKGGSAGQVLRKHSGTDLDVEWVNQGTPTDEQVADAVVDWLNGHPEATTTVDFSVAVKVFPNVAAMVEDLTLKNGDNVATKGYYASGDNGGTNYVVSSSHTGVFYITLDNGLYANMLSETGLLNAKTVGLKGYANKTAAASDTDGMEQNRIILENIIAHGFRVYIPEGVYAFDDCINCENQSLYIRGASRHKTALYFPLSGGLYLNKYDYYNYPYIGHINIESKDKCFECTSNVKNVVCGLFEYLWLKSIDDECFVAPPENLGSVPIGQSFDTCMWGNHFYYIHGQSANGAVFANLCGSGNKWERINSYSSKYAFRNCTGQIEHYYSLGETLDHFLYYDDMIIHSGNLTLINAVAEAVKKSFIFCEDSIANTFTIDTLNCIDSGATYDSHVENSTYYPIKVGRLNKFYVWGAHIPVPATLTSRWDESVKAPIFVQYGTIRQYYGLPHGIKVSGPNNMLYTLSTPANTEVANSGNALWQKWAYPTSDVLAADRLFGGRMHQTLNVDATDLTTPNYTLPTAYHNVDVINVTVETTDTYKKFGYIRSDANVIGRQLVLINNANSTANFQLQGASGSELVNGSFYAPDGSWLTLVPGEAAFLILDNCTYGGITRLAYRRINYNGSVIKDDYTFKNGFGVVLTSPDDTKYRLVVANDGTLSTEQLV